MKKRHLLLHLPLLLVALCTWFVLWFMAMGALTPTDELKVTLGPALAAASDRYAAWELLPSWPTLQPLTEVLMDTPAFFAMFWNTCRLVIPQVLGQFLIAAPAAWALARLRFPGRGLLRLIYLILMLMPFQVTMVPNYLVLDALHLMDTPWAIILPGCFSTFPVFIIMRGFEGIPESILEAAALDGAGYWHTFVQISIPIAMPSIIAALTLGFIDAWNAIEQPMVFLRDKSIWPLSLLLPQITSEDLGFAMVVSLLTLLPPVLIFLFGQKYLELGFGADDDAR